MKRTSYLICFVALVLAGTGCKSSRSKTDDASVERRVDSVLKLMTLDEKIGQLTLFTSDYDVTGPTIRENYKEDIKAGRVGAIFNAYGVDYVKELQRMAVEETRLKIPLIFGYDVIHGHRTIFPISLGESASWDTAMVRKAARIAAIEATAEGLNWTFAPMVDIARDPRWGRISEGAGEDVFLGQCMAAARVKGFQGNRLDDPRTLLACAKHYAAYGAAQAGRDYHTVDISERTLREVYLPPFKAAVDAGVGSFMTSFNEIAGVPSTGNRHLLTDILRNEWGFRGFVVTDYTSINEMVNHGFARDEKEAGELAINAGVDMDMQGAVYYNYLKKSIEEGKVSMATVDEAVRRVLRMKFKLGLFDNPYLYCSKEREQNEIMTQEHLDFARDMARKSMVLLKNDAHVLPISREVKTLAVIGPLADNRRELIASWSAAGDWTKAITILEGIKSAVSPNTKILFARGCNINDDTTAFISEAVNKARQADVVVLVVGEAHWMSGEAASRSELGLPGVQQQLADAVMAAGKPVVTVLLSGRPLTIPRLAEKTSALLAAWFPGTMAGPAVADVLFGDYNPSAKLPVTFPRSVGQIPIYYNMKNTGRPMDPNNKYTSKYLDVPNDPLFPFGYGLSYTTFEYSDLQLSAEKIKASDTLYVKVKVKNTGKYSGEETVQLYVRDLVGSVTRPVKELKGFYKVFLQPGEEKQVTFKLTANDLAFYDIHMKFTSEPGDFIVFVGGDSQHCLQKGFVLE
ncbi:MAG: beta-glucosidase BglX [Bacteroidales bacterium]